MTIQTLLKLRAQTFVAQFVFLFVGVAMASFGVDRPYPEIVSWVWVVTVVAFFSLTFVAWSYKEKK